MHHEELSHTYSHTLHQCTMRNYHKHIFTLYINAPWGTITNTHSTSIHHEELLQTHIHTPQHQCTIRTYHKGALMLSVWICVCNSSSWCIDVECVFVVVPHGALMLSVWICVCDSSSWVHWCRVCEYVCDSSSWCIDVEYVNMCLWYFLMVHWSWVCEYVFVIVPQWCIDVECVNMCVIVPNGALMLSVWICFCDSS